MTGAPHRPELHFTPPTGWLNDPNGLVWHDGEYHLFYQHHPAADVWGPMHWGHAVSHDLIHWAHLPIAVLPDDQGWIFSGSAVVDRRDTAGFGPAALVALYTIAAAAGQSQGLAFSTDRGRTFTPFAGNPVLLAPDGRPDFRDPKVFRWAPPRGGDPPVGPRVPGRSDEGHWVMVLAAGPSVLFYTSADLRSWALASELRPGCAGEGDAGGDGAEAVTWETPDLFLLPVAGSGESRWVLSLGAMAGAPAGGGGTCYLVGDFDGRRFVPDGPGLRWADHGPDFYAAQTWNDHPGGERVWLAWMGSWAYAEQVPSVGWRGVMSLPRELRLVRGAEGLRLAQRPVAALGAALAEVGAFRSAAPIAFDAPAAVDALTRVTQGPPRACVDLSLACVFEPRAGAALEIRAVTGEGEWTSVTYEPGSSSLVLDRGRAGPHAFHREQPSRFSAPLEPIDGVVTLRIVADSCSVEVFGNDGLTTMSALAFPAGRGYRLELAVNEAPGRAGSLGSSGGPGGSGGAVSPVRLVDLRLAGSPITG